MGALTFLGRFWCSGTGTMSNVLYSIDPARGIIEGQTTTIFNIRDLSSNGFNLFATNELGKIVKFGNHPSIVETILDIPIIQPYGLACEGDNFLVSDYQTNFIYRLDASQKIKAVYRPFTFWEGQGIIPVNNLLYLTFDPLGYIYANDGNYVYKYKVEG
jgi:hypothetical protein